MLCYNCGKNNATTHIKQIINGNLTEMHLCSECAKQGGYIGFKNNSVSDMISSFFADTSSLNAVKAKTCPVCGSSYSDIASSGKVGCAECYKTFLNQLLPHLKRIHGNVRHIGKIPFVTEESGDNVVSLRNELKRLISEEKFEEAAVIRDKIKELEGGTNE